jgi:hypothetical protein
VAIGAQFWYRAGAGAAEVDRVDKLLQPELKSKAK